MTNIGSMINVGNIINGGLFDPNSIFGGINFTMPNTGINNGYVINDPNLINIGIGNVIDPYVVVDVNAPIFTTNVSIPSVPSINTTTIVNTTIPVIEPLNPTTPIIPVDPSITLPDDPNTIPIIPIIPTT